MEQASFSADGAGFQEPHAAKVDRNEVVLQLLASSVTQDGILVTRPVGLEASARHGGGIRDRSTR
jgi:hypothetical protein